MKTRVMRNRIAVYTIMVILLTNISVASAQPQKGSHKQGLFDLQFVMTISWGNETQTPIHPGEVREAHLEITYVVTHGEFGRILLRLLQGRPFPMRLSIEGKPDWCTAQIFPENMTGVIEPDETQNKISMLSLSLNEGAPLNYSLGYVKIIGVIDDMKGPFNILTRIHGYETNVTLSFVTSP
jgi:hypothetical protein